MPFGVPGSYRVSSHVIKRCCAYEDFTVKQNKKPLFCQFHVDVALQEHQVPQVCVCV